MRSDSKIRSGTGRTSAVPQCFQPARLIEFPQLAPFLLSRKKNSADRGPPERAFRSTERAARSTRAQAATAARAPRAAAEGRPGHHQCPSHRRRGGSGADRPSISGGATAFVGAPAAVRRGCHRTGRRAPGGAFVVHGGPSTPASLLGALESRGSCWRRRWDRRRRQQRSRI